MINNFVKGLNELKERRQSSIDCQIDANGKKLQRLNSEDVEDVIYTFDEVTKLVEENVTIEGLIAIHNIKKAFPGASIQEISD